MTTDVIKTDRQKMEEVFMAWRAKNPGLLNRKPARPDTYMTSERCPNCTGWGCYGLWKMHGLSFMKCTNCEYRINLRNG